MTLILRPIEDSETVTELIGTGTDLNIVPKLIWGNEKGMQDFQTKQIQHYRSRAAGEYGGQYEMTNKLLFYRHFFTLLCSQFFIFS